MAEEGSGVLMSRERKRGPREQFSYNARPRRWKNDGMDWSTTSGLILVLSGSPGRRSVTSAGSSPIHRIAERSFIRTPHWHHRRFTRAGGVRGSSIADGLSSVSLGLQLLQPC